MYVKNIKYRNEESRLREISTSGGCNVLSITLFDGIWKFLKYRQTSWKRDCGFTYGRRIFIIFQRITRAPTRLPTGASIEFQTKFKLRLIWLANEQAKAKWSETRVYRLRAVRIRSSGDSVRYTDSIIDLQPRFIKTA